MMMMTVMMMTMMMMMMMILWCMLYGRYVGNYFLARQEW